VKTFEPRYQYVARSWAEITIKRFRRKLYLYGIGDGNLAKSLKFNVDASSTGISKITLNYLKYGQYVDMGVGKGMPAGKLAGGRENKWRKSNGQIKSLKRTPKKWYSPVIFFEEVMLMHVMAREIGDTSVKNIMQIPRRLELPPPI
jgi:hypothetical protein